MFGILTKRGIKDNLVFPICLVAPILTFCLDLMNNADWYIKKLKLTGGFAFGLLYFFSKNQVQQELQAEIGEKLFEH
jgi:hypothetical protein